MGPDGNRARACHRPHDQVVLAKSQGPLEQVGAAAELLGDYGRLPSAFDIQPLQEALNCKPATETRRATGPRTRATARKERAKARKGAAAGIAGSRTTSPAVGSLSPQLAVLVALGQCWQGHAPVLATAPQRVGTARAAPGAADAQPTVSSAAVSGSQAAQTREGAGPHSP